MSERTCSIEGCENSRHGFGLCNTHYRQWRRANGIVPVSPICSIEGCEILAKCRGWCNTHYYRWYRRDKQGDPTVARPAGKAMQDLIRLASIVTDDCVLWTRGHTKAGYGLISRPNYGGQTTTSALVCEWTHGPRPAGMQAAHSCGVKPCVNPRHLRWATQAQNEADKMAHGTYFVRGVKAKKP